MAFNLGTIESKVKVDGLAQFGDDLKKADATMDAFAQQTSKRFTRVAMDVKAMAKATGQSAQEMQNSLDRAMKNISADTATKSLERMARQMGLSRQEVEGLGRQLGLSAGTINGLTSKLYSLSASSKSTESALGGLKTAAIAVGSAFAAYKVADFVKDSAMLAARYETLGVAMETVGANAGYTAGEMNATATALQKTGISMVESRQQATKLVQAHLDLSKATDLARVAQNAAVIAGENSSTTFGRLVDAIQTAQPEMLRTVGINVNFEASYKKLASQLGITAESLSENEKMQARFNAVMEKAPDIAGVYERAMGTAGKAISSFSRYVDDYQVMMGGAFGPALQQFVDEATRSMKAFQDEISRPEAQQGLSSLASGAAQLGTNLMRSAVPALNSAVTAINDLVNAWGKIPAPLQGMILGGGAAALVSKFNPTAMMLGAVGGAAYTAEATKSLDTKIAEAQKVYNELNGQKGGIGGWITSIANGDGYLDGLISKQKDKLDSLLKQRNEMGKPSEIRLPVALVGPDGKPLEKTVKKKLEEVSYSATDSDNILKGSGTAQYQLGEAWTKNLGIITQLQRKVDSGKLSQEDMTRAINDQKEAWGRIGDAQESYEKKASKGKGGANAAARYAEQASGYLQQAQDQFDQLTAQLGGDALGAKLAAIDKKYDAAETAIRKGMIGAKGATDEARAALEQLEQNRALEKQIAASEAWKKAMSDAANMLGELGRLTGDPDALYGASMTTNQAWEAEQQKRIGAIQDADERAKQSSELQRVMTLKEIEARRQGYEGVAAVSSKYWDAERERIEAHLEVVKSKADNETAYKIYAAQEWDEYNRRLLEQQAQYAGTFADTLAAKWSLAFGGYESETTKAKKRWDSMSDGIVDATNGMVDGVSGGLGDLIRNVGNGTASIEDLWKNMLARMLDMFASFVEDLIKSQLKSLLGGMFSGDSSNGSGFSLSNLLGGSSSSKLPATAVNYVSTGSTGSGGGISDLLTGTLGKGLTSLFSSGTTGAATSLASAGLAGGITEAATGAIAPWATTTAAAAMTEGAIPAMTGAMAPAILGSGVEAAGTASLSAGIMGAGAMSGAATMGIGLAVAAGIAGIMALTSGQEEKEPTKTASGYNVAYKGGHSAAYGVDFYSDGSVQTTGASDPDIQKKISDSFKDTAENLSDFAEELGFVIDVLDGFEFPNMNITEDQLDSYIRNGQNQMAFQGLMEAGLRGAFDTVLEDGEIYVDEVERLANAFKSVVGSFEGYGYSMKDVAQISQEQIDNLRIKNTEVAEGTAQALATMAAAMGAASSTVSELASNTSIADAALKVTDEQLQNILEADYASKLLDAVGGEDAFKSIMGNLTENIFDTIDAYAENLGYYTTKAETAIGKLGDATVTVDNFWEMFDAAIKGGLTVDEFEAWGKASEWVNQIDSVTEAIDDFNNAMNSLDGSLDAREAEALGMSDQAKYITLLYNAENELYEARKNNYDEAIIAKIQEVQQLEEARALYEIAKKSTQGVQDLNVREMEVTGNPYADIIQAYYDNGWELQEAMESGLYSEADIARMADIQKKEVEKLWEELADAIAEAAQDAHSRMMKSGGKTDAAELYDFQVQAVKELEDALESGLYTAESYSELMRSIALEAKNLEKSQARERKSSFIDAYMTGPLELERQKNQHIMTVLQNQVSVVESVKVLLDGTYQSIESAYNTMNSLADGLRNTLQGFKWNDNLSRNTATQTFSEQSSYYQSLLTKVNNTPKSDMDYSKNIGNLQSFAGTYLESAKSYYGASTEYWKIYDAVTTKFSGLQIDTQTDSDIYKEQLLVQKEIVNKNQLEIDALTLSNSMIGELISVLSLVQAADDLAYKQEAVAQNMTIAQLDEIVGSISAGSTAVGTMTVEIVSTLNEIISQSANTADSFTSSVTSSMSSTEAAINSMSSIVGSSIAGTNSNITSMSAGINSSIAGTNSNISASSAGLNTSIAGTNSNLTSMSAGLNESITGTNDNITAVNDGLNISIAGTNSNITASSAGLNMGISLLSSGLTSSISGTNSNINVLSGVLGTATAGTNNSIISMTDKLLAPITGNTTSISAMATNLFSAAAKTDGGLATVSSSLTTVSSGIFSTSASVNTMSSNVVGAIGGTGTLLNSLISAAYANAANQINVQQAIYNAESSATNAQIGKLDLQNQLAQLAIKNAEYQSQLLNANKSILAGSYINEQMQIALLTTLANYAAYQSSLTGSGLNADATANWYLSEINRIVNGGYNYWVMAGGYAEAIYNRNNELVSLSNGIYNYSSGMYGYLQAIYNKMGTSSSYLGGFASGGEVTGPGWFMAGENGPEPVLLKGGSASVTSNGDFTGSVDTNTKVTAAGLSALLTEMKAMRKELAQIRSTGQRAVAAPARN